jgi:hypothetical protein
MYNPKTLGTNYFLHHWGVYSVSPFVPAIMFTVGGDGTSVDIVTQTVTGMTLTPDTKNVSPGDSVELTVALTGSLSPNVPYLKVSPSAATYEATVEHAATEGTAGVYTATLSGTFAEDDTIKIGDTTVTVTAAMADNTAVASAIVTAMASDATYTVTSSGAVVTFTEKSGKYGTGAPTIVKTSTAGVITQATTTAGVAPTDAYAKNSPRTRVDEYGILHVARSLVAGDVITVVATSTYINPSGSTETYTDSGTYTVV